MNSNDRLEQQLRGLRDAAEQSILRDVRFTPEFADRIISRAASGIRQPSVLRKFRGLWRPGSLAAAAFCVLVVAGVITYVHRGTRPLQAVEAWNENFEPIDGRYVNQYFSDVKEIDLLLGKDTFQPMDNGTTVHVKLTADESQRLHAIMQGARWAKPNPIPEADSFVYNLSFIRQEGGNDIGFYASNGAMEVPVTFSNAGNQMGVCSPNPALQDFVNTVILSKLNQQLKEHGKVLLPNLTQAALSMVHALSDPGVAYQYCIPNVLTEHGFDLAKLGVDARKYGFQDYRIVDTQMYGDSTAMIQVAPPDGKQGERLTVRMEKIGDGWIAVQIGQQISWDRYDGNSPQGSFGHHHAFIMGRQTPDNALSNVSVQMFDKQDVSDADFAHSDILVYELQTDIKSPGDLIKELQSSQAFQAAWMHVKKYGGILAITGDSHGTLSRENVIDVLGPVQSVTGLDNTGAQCLTVRYLGGSDVYMGGLTEFYNGGTPVPFSKALLGEALGQAALELDLSGHSTPPN